MSSRGSTRSQNQSLACGSLYGKAVSFWDDMTISPPRSPSASPPLLATGAIYERLSDLSLTPAVITAVASAPAAVRSLVHVHGVPVEEFAACCLMYFEDAVSEILASPRRRSLGAVLPRLVFADTIVWNPVISPDGTHGHSFILQLDGETQATVEVIGERIVILQAAFSALAVEAGTASPSTRLVFDSKYPKELAAVISKVRDDEELGYLPNSDLLVGRQLDRIPLKGWSGSDDASARHVWCLTRERLKATNALVSEGVLLQNRRELTSAGVSTKEIGLVNLRAYFV